MNKRNFQRSVLIGIILLMSSAAAFSQASNPNYNKANETTVKGTVTAVSKVESAGVWGGTLLAIKTDNGILDVHVGPASFLEQNKISFAKGDQIEATGSKATFFGDDAILAREIKKGNQALTLRDARGFPLWRR